MGYRYPDARIVLFAKAPVPGTVKTRLARRYGPAGAARLHRRMTERAAATLADSGLAPVELSCAPDVRHPFFARCRSRYGIALGRQGSGELGQRMHRVISHRLREARRVVIVGSDCPALTADYVAAALDALGDGRDAVLGPSDDGGYVLIGARRPMPEVFRGMAWGSSRVLAASLARLRRHGYSHACLPALWDVDVPADRVRAARLGLL